jgi:uncharacterized membrane protein
MEQVMAEAHFRTHEAIIFGWRRFKENAGFLLLLGLGLGVLMLIANGLQRAAVGAPPVLSVLYLAVVAVNAFISFAVVAATLEIHDYGEAGIDDVRRQLPVFPQYLVGYVLFGAAIIIGYFLLILPGIYLTVKLFFYMYLVVDRKMNGIDALKTSYEMTAGRFREVFVFLLAIFAINVVGFLLMGIGLLVTIPVTSIAAAHVYRSLSGKPPS